MSADAMNRSKQKGTAFETAVVDYLREQGWPQAERRALTGAHDKGDLNLHPSVVVEVKNHAAMSLAEWVDEAEVERTNARAEIGVVWHKRRGKSSPGHAYVTMTGATFADLLDRAGLR